jgi:hypothetical protein
MRDQALALLPPPATSISPPPAVTNHTGSVIGRKNHYGSRSKRGAEVAALFYSLIESAKPCGVEPKAYLLCALRAALATPGTVTLPHTLAHEIPGRSAASLRPRRGIASTYSWSTWRVTRRCQSVGLCTNPGAPL